MKQVKNISGQELMIPGIGMVSPDSTLNVPADFNNANFVVVEEKVEEKEKSKKEIKSKK
jgi:hypothetical protein